VQHRDHDEMFQPDRPTALTPLAVATRACATRVPETRSFAASPPDAKSPDVLTVANHWLRWVEGEGEG
jgi:hypothetical protein